MSAMRTSCKRHVGKKALLAHGTVSHFYDLKVNLNLQYFCLIEIWKSEVQG